MNLKSWLIDRDLGQLFDVLAANDIDFELLLELTEQDLQEVGLTIGARKRLLKALNAEKSADGHQVAPAPGPKEYVGGEPGADKNGRVERRHLSVMFVDMIGSTELSVRLDPEDLLTLMRAYRQCVSEIIRSHNGHIERFIGDGILCIFGWPKANEDDAERAVRAGLKIAEAVRSLSGVDGAPLQVRVGIASGIVVIGDPVMTSYGREECIYGQTPNLAARLQHLAKAGQVIISQTTRELVGKAFEIEKLGVFKLKGIQAPVEAFVAFETRDLQSRFELRTPRILPEMIGREAEFSSLVHHWTETVAGRGRCVIVSGEAGIGKSRLAEALAEDIAGQPHTTIRYQCSPHHSATPLYPAIRQLTRDSGILPTDNLAQKIEKLRAIMPCDDVEAVASLVGTEDRIDDAGDEPFDARQMRLRTFKALLTAKLTMSRENPLLVIIEDAHWIDPTFLEMIEIALGAIPQERIMILMTARPEFDRLPESAAVVRLALSRLSSRDIRIMIGDRAGGNSIPERLVATIESRSDGIPLFIEEMTKALIQSGHATNLDAVLPDSLEIPVSLQDILMARLDKLDVAKTIAQIAACIGREFSGRLLAQVADIDDAVVDKAIDDLIRTEIVFSTPGKTDSIYAFNHVLLRDAAYASLLKVRRREIHSRILDTLNADGETKSEVLAKHAGEAGQTQRSIDLWRVAARHATKRCAYQEAADHLESAIALTEELADRADGEEQALELLGWLAFTNIAALGYMSDYARSATDRGVALANRLTESRHRFTPLYADWTLSLAVGPQSEALRKIEAVVEKTKADDGAPHRFFAHAFAGYSCLANGLLEQAQHHLQTAGDAFDPDRHNQNSDRFGHIPGPDLFYRRGFLALLQARAGDAARLIDQAHESCPPGIDTHAEAQLLMKTALVALFLRDFDRLEGYVRRLQAIADRYELPLAKINADLYRAQLLIAHGNGDGVELFRKASQRYEDQIMIFLSASRWVAHGDVLLRAGMNDAARSACHHASKLIETTGETLAAPELLRLTAEIAALDGEHDLAEEGLSRAIELARKQSALLWELRGAASIAKLRRPEGEKSRACAFLRPVYERLPQGHDWPDLVEARNLLDALRETN